MISSQFGMMIEEFYNVIPKMETVLDELHIAVKHEEVSGYYASIFQENVGSIILFRKDKFLSVNDSAYSMTLNYVVDKFFDGKVKILKSEEYKYCTLISISEKSKTEYLEYAMNKSFMYIYKRKAVPFNMIKSEGYLSYIPYVESKFINGVLQANLDVKFGELGENKQVYYILKELK